MTPSPGRFRLTEEDGYQVCERWDGKRWAFVGLHTENPVAADGGFRIPAPIVRSMEASGFLPMTPGPERDRKMQAGYDPATVLGTCGMPADAMIVDGRMVRKEEWADVAASTFQGVSIPPIDFSPDPTPTVVVGGR